MRESINLAQAGPGNFRRTRSRFVEALWILVEFLLVTNPLQVSSGVLVCTHCYYSKSMEQ